MAFYIRFLSTDLQPITLGSLGEALRALDSDYAISRVGSRHRVMRGQESFGEIEITFPGEELFAEEIEDLKAALADLDELATQPIRQAFFRAQTIVVVRVLWERRDTPETLERLKPLWDWLLANRSGLLQIDDEGYFDSQGRVLEVR